MGPRLALIRLSPFKDRSSRLSAARCLPLTLSPPAPPISLPTRIASFPSLITIQLKRSGLKISEASFLPFAITSFSHWFLHAISLLLNKHFYGAPTMRWVLC